MKSAPENLKGGIDIALGRSCSFVVVVVVVVVVSDTTVSFQLYSTSLGNKLLISISVEPPLREHSQDKCPLDSSRYKLICMIWGLLGQKVMSP